MKNKGFTLIELLAVIVILAIIALIATPIILGIINDTREESNQRNIDLYARAVGQAVARYELNHPDSSLKYGEFTMSENGKTLIDSNGEKLTVEFDGPTINCTTVLIDEENGTVSLDNCKVNGTGNYNYGISKDAVCILTEEKYSYTVNLSQFPTDSSYNEYIKGTIEVLTCDSEKFYIMEKTSTTIKAVAKYNLNITSSPYLQDTSKSSNYLKFWNAAPQVWPTNGTNVYENTENLIKPYVETYKNHLITKIGMNGINVRLMTLDEAISFGFGDNPRFTPIYPKELYSPGYYLSTYDDGLTYIGSYYYYNDYDNMLYQSGIRPLVEIPTELVK